MFLDEEPIPFIVAIVSSDGGRPKRSAQGCRAGQLSRYTAMSP
jgi:hypothetical protein